MSTEQNENFTNYVTGSSFTMTLSKNQIAVLAAIANEDVHSVSGQLVASGGNSSTVYSANGLKVRGLITHQNDAPPFYRCTEEGWLMVELLKRCGLISTRNKRQAA